MSTTQVRLAALSGLPRDDAAPFALIAGAVLLALSAGLISALFGGLVAILFFAVIAFMAFALSDYRTGIVIAMVLLPLSSSILMPRTMLGITGLNPLNATLAMAGISIAFALLFQRARLKVPPLPRPLIVYVGLLAAAALYGASQVGMIPPFFRLLQIINFDSAGGYLRDVFAKPLLILATAWLLAVLVCNARDPRRFLLPFFLSALALPLFVIAYVSVNGASLGALASASARDTLSVSGMHANELGLMFNMTLALAVFTLLGARGLARWGLFAACGVLLAAVMLTFSRGAFLGTLVLAVYFLITQRRFKILAGGLLILPFGLLLLPDAVIERAATGLASGNLDIITAGRIDRIWAPLLPELLQSPLFGHGLYAMLWSDAVRAGITLKVGHPHNAYIATLQDVGLVGAAVIAWFFWRMRGLFAVLRARLSDPMLRGFFHGANACILLLLVQGLTDDRFTPTFPQTYLWLAYGIALGMAARGEQRT